MRALSIRQPYAEMILRGEKTIEYRSRPTKIIGERFYIYASKGTKPWRHVGTQGRPPEPEALPRGVIVGTAVISHCTNGGTGRSAYEWHLIDVQRIKRPRKPRGRPQPVWFRPF